jgi:hypothetical protein
MGTRKRASMWASGSQLSKIIFELLSTQIKSDRHPPIWRVDLSLCGPMYTRRTRRLTTMRSLITLVSSSGRRLRRIADSRIWIGSTGHLDLSPDKAIKGIGVGYVRNLHDQILKRLHVTPHCLFLSNVG